MSKKRLFRAALIFASGFVSCIVALTLLCLILDRYDDDFMYADRLVSKWGLATDDEGRLIINLHEGSGEGRKDWIVQIHHSDDEQELVSLSFGGRYGDFTYYASGPLGIPSTRYSMGGDASKGEVLWVDLNADGSFDQKLQWGVEYTDGKVKVLIDDDWVLAKKITDGRAITAKGDYIFSLETGKYELSPEAIEAPAAD